MDVGDGFVKNQTTTIYPQVVHTFAHSKRGGLVSIKIIFFSRKRLINLSIQNSCNFFF